MLTWPIIIPDSHAAVWNAASPADRAAAEATAVTILHALTARIFGLTSDTVRPCGAPAPNYSTYGGSYRASPRSGAIVQGPLLLSSCGCTVAPCPCGGRSEVALPGPVHSITEVRVDGAVIDPTTYKVRDHRWLVRISGAPWPQHQQMEAADDEPGAFVVTYLRGLAVPPAGHLAAGLLALELLKGMTGSGPCALPPHITNLSRQGVTTEIDPVAYLDAALTGVTAVDQWIRTVNPNALKAAPTVLSPDTVDKVARFS